MMSLWSCGLGAWKMSRTLSEVVGNGYGLTRPSSVEALDADDALRSNSDWLVLQALSHALLHALRLAVGGAGPCG